LATVSNVALGAATRHHSNTAIFPESMRLLLIEDDLMFGKALVRGLKRNGMTVD